MSSTTNAITRSFLRVHLEEIAAMCGQTLERDRLALACSLEPDHVAEERRHGLDVVRAQADVSNPLDPHVPTLIPSLASYEPDAPDVRLHRAVP
jgi:hypothetical protein